MASGNVHHSSCPLCEAGCGIVVETKGAGDDAEVVSIRGDADDSMSQGFICPKVMGLVDLHTDPDRLRTPRKRVGDAFVEISWKQAFDEIGERVRAIRAEHGRDAVGVYQGNPTVHNLGLLLYGQLLFRQLRTRNLFSATSTDQLPHMLAGLQMFGHHLLMPVPDIDRTDLMIIMGGNPVVSGGSLMTAPGFKRRAEALRARGGELIVIDPRRTETAAIADRHLFIRPGTDALLLLAMIRTLFEDSLVKLGRLEPLVRGTDTLRQCAEPFAPERVADDVGIDAATIRELAAQLASTPRAVVYGRVGICQNEFGGLTTWLINAINLLCGHLDEPGGAMFSKPAVDLAAIAKLVRFTGTFGSYRSRVSDLPEFAGELPVAAMAEEIETPGPRQIRALFTSAGNPVLSVPNGPRLSKALDSLDLMVSLDLYINETTRHADYILPPTSALEREHYDIGLAIVMVRNHAKYSDAVFPRPAGAMHDWEICCELGKRIFTWREPVARAAIEGARAMGPRGVIAAGLATGPYRLRLRTVRANVHGMDLGAHEPRLPGLLGKRDGARLIRIAPTMYVGDVARLEARLARGPAADLVLIGRRQLRSNNSWMHNCYRLVKGKPRCTLLIHPDDASRRGLAPGDEATITSVVGALRVAVEISDEMMPGVVSLPHGWGHDRDGTQMRVAREHAGVSINDITSERAVDPLSGNSALNGLAVSVAAAEARAVGT